MIDFKLALVFLIRFWSSNNKISKWNCTFCLKNALLLFYYYYYQIFCMPHSQTTVSFSIVPSLHHWTWVIYLAPGIDWFSVRAHMDRLLHSQSAIWLVNYCMVRSWFGRNWLDHVLVRKCIASRRTEWLVDGFFCSDWHVSRPWPFS